jgi:hypothetical protein
MRENFLTEYSNIIICFRFTLIKNYPINSSGITKTVNLIIVSLSPNPPLEGGAGSPPKWEGL